MADRANLRGSLAGDGFRFQSVVAGGAHGNRDQPAYRVFFHAARLMGCRHRRHRRAGALPP